jgi:glycolate oxidase FAD binding subunit
MNGFVELERLIEPSEVGELAEEVRAAFNAGRAVYPRGGGTKQAYGGPGRERGLGLGLGKLHLLVDYAARDLTITVQAGMPLAELQRILARENQWWPVSAPDADRATVGGIVMTAWPGPRQGRYGGAGDYFLGFRAVDGRGQLFSAGGKVVKNAAGYNLPRLFAGSLGVLGIVVEVTLMVRPRPETTTLLLAGLKSFEEAEEVLVCLGPLQSELAATELLFGPEWGKIGGAFPAVQKGGQPLWLLLGLEGWEDEVVQMEQEVKARLGSRPNLSIERIPQPQATTIWQVLEEFSGEGSPVRIQMEANSETDCILVMARMLPARVPAAAGALAEVPGLMALQAHAASGVVWCWVKTERGKLGDVLTGQLRPAVGRWGGKVVLARRPRGWQVSSQMVWGMPEESGSDVSALAKQRLFAGLKAQFDPRGILNPGRMPW